MLIKNDKYNGSPWFPFWKQKPFNSWQGLSILTGFLAKEMKDLQLTFAWYCNFRLGKFLSTGVG